MADRRLLNTGSMVGNYAGTPFDETDTTEVEVLLTDVSFEKEASESLWVNGDLTYTLTLDNTEGEGPFEQMVFNDTLDNTKFKYKADSVVAQLTDSTGAEVNLVLDTDYTVAYTAETPDEDHDLLRITLLPGGAAATIPVGDILTIQFSGEKVPAITP